MDKKILIAIDAILLAVALILPIYASIVEENQTFADLLNINSAEWGDQTAINAFFATAVARQQAIYSAVAIVEAVLVAIFVVILWRIIKVR